MSTPFKYVNTIVSTVSLILVLIGSTGCTGNESHVNTTNHVTVQQVLTTTDVVGNEYRLYSPETILPDGTVVIELWERIKPHDTNRLYVKTLSSKLNPANVPIFTSVAR